MRETCLLLALACVPVFGQEVTPVTPLPSPRRLEQLKEKLLPQGLSARPTPRRFIVHLSTGGGTCSIPLLNAAPPAQPVKMPKVMPPKEQVGKLMPNGVPAPACPSNMAHVGAPAPAIDPPAAPPPGTPAPRKP
ncbi:MAG TPA: hypothetical protein VHC72_14415 [Bryobacteraceae bacterium]|nr:hypothetical protein [Bryobacteraceae bacterium]